MTHTISFIEFLTMDQRGNIDWYPTHGKQIETRDAEYIIQKFTDDPATAKHIILSSYHL